MKYIGVVVALVIAAFLIMDFNSRTANLNRLNQERLEVKSEHDSKAATKSALQARIAYATSQAAVYEWAYQNHMVQKGDIPVVPVGDIQPTPVPTPRPASTQKVLSNTDRWLLLFIDPE
jgi:hypothetical protein